MKRLDYIDTAKGICMLLIILGHCAAGTSARRGLFLITWIYSFHTTAFFVITGMLMEHVREYDRPFGKTLVSNARRLLLPYFFFQVTYTLWFCCMNGFGNFAGMMKEVFLLVDWDYATWFLPVLFVGKTAVNLCRKLIKDCRAAGVILVPLYLTSLRLSMFETIFPFPWLYWLLVRSMLGMGFLYIGTILYRYRESFRKIYVLLPALGISLVTAYMNRLVSVYHLRFHDPLLFTVSAISGAVFVLSLSMYVKSRILTFFGRGSVTALGVHQIILRSFPKGNILLWFVVTPLTALVMYLFTRIRNLFRHSKMLNKERL